MGRLQNWVTSALGASRRLGSRLWAAARDPVRVLPTLAILALVLVGVPLTLAGLTRMSRVALDWRQDSVTTWRETTGVLVKVRDQGGMVAKVSFRDREGDRRQADVFVGDTGRRWVDVRPAIRYNRDDPTHVEIVGFGEPDPVAGLLLAGAPLGAGLAALSLALGVWRRRRLVVVSARPVEALRGALILATVIALAGVAAWAAGTILERGWSAVASGAGHLVSTVFGDLLGVLVPLVAFALGALVASWLARHRGGGDQTGMLSRAHHLIDRAAGRMPSPEELRAERREVSPTGPDRPK